MQASSRSDNVAGRRLSRLQRSFAALCKEPCQGARPSRHRLEDLTRRFRWHQDPSPAKIIQPLFNRLMFLTRVSAVLCHGHSSLSCQTHLAMLSNRAAMGSAAFSGTCRHCVAFGVSYQKRLQVAPHNRLRAADFRGSNNLVHCDSTRSQCIPKRLKRYI